MNLVLVKFDLEVTRGSRGKVIKGQGKERKHETTLAFLTTSIDRRALDAVTAEARGKVPLRASREVKAKQGGERQKCKVTQKTKTNNTHQQFDLPKSQTVQREIKRRENSCCCSASEKLAWLHFQTTSHDDIKNKQRHGAHCTLICVLTTLQRICLSNGVDF